ncbi:Heterokaryon incompatibility protein 6,OR allele [Lachnellula hyalina]|uniref:Heterokaryon incompatibility protein 6,OR allele n=1 Tax=Lachnellula hyalina TaxID=1316788 RepID=A0A8H8R774_9HELO|nr:Heterokaryon incompatibility protein 6,OR allele [Lachnellula hyalina]TVY28800.1 Heterokaryon incompatibility protein 6,OR allele [Lachnellula hyalina]
MFIQRLISRRAVQTFRKPFIYPFPLSTSSRNSIQHLSRRLASSTTRTVPRVSSKKQIFPERVLVYHAGTGRTVFLGSLKVTTIFIATFFCAVLGPTYYYAENEPPWVSVIVILSGIIPMISVLYMTSPFVNYIHLRLPPFARNSTELMRRFTKTLPRDAEIDITTMNVLGKPRVARMKIQDLSAANERFGLVNYVRDTKAINERRKWWMGKAVRQFGVHGGKGSMVGGEAWKDIQAAIAKRGEKGCRENVTMPIEMDGSTYPVTINLYSALRNLRKPSEVRLMWVDSISINQRDDEEKSQQVNLMRDMYASANTCVVWFGDFLDHGITMTEATAFLDTLVEMIKI